MLFGWNLRCSTSQVRLCCAYWVAASRLGVVVVAGFVSNDDAIAADFDAGEALDWACPADFLFAVRGTAI